MTTTDTTNKLGITVVKDLRTVMQGKVAIAGEASYDEARQVFNGAVDRRPALFAFCESARDVQEAVRAARAYGLPLSVRGGGHDWAGRALSDHGLVVDLSRMRQVDVDVRGRVATVAGGALAGDVIAAAGPHGLAPVTGASGTVGLAGLLTGGATALFCRDSVWRSIICSARKLCSQMARLSLRTVHTIPNCFGLFAVAAAISE
jgi:FAD/FMN-containing dehydrogenase